MQQACLAAHVSTGVTLVRVQAAAPTAHIRGLTDCKNIMTSWYRKAFPIATTGVFPHKGPEMLHFRQSIISAELLALLYNLLLIQNISFNILITVYQMFVFFYNKFTYTVPSEQMTGKHPFLRRYITRNFQFHSYAWRLTLTNFHLMGLAYAWLQLMKYCQPRW